MCLLLLLLLCNLVVAIAAPEFVDLTVDDSGEDAPPPQNLIRIHNSGADEAGNGEDNDDNSDVDDDDDDNSDEDNIASNVNAARYAQSLELERTMEALPDAQRAVIMRALSAGKRKAADQNAASKSAGTKRTSRRPGMRSRRNGMREVCLCWVVVWERV